MARIAAERRAILARAPVHPAPVSPVSPSGSAKSVGIRDYPHGVYGGAYDRDYAVAPEVDDVVVKQEEKDGGEVEDDARFLLSPSDFLPPAVEEVENFDQDTDADEDSGSVVILAVVPAGATERLRRRLENALIQLD